MSQKRIPLISSYVYHVWTHANGDENLFRDHENYDYFLKQYIKYVFPVVDTYAYCLMPNHIHLMIRVKCKQDILDFYKKKKKNPELNSQEFESFIGVSKVLSQQFSNLFNSYTQAYNNKYNRKGSLFIPNFNRKLIDSDEYFTRLITYIHNNPIHHGFCDNLYNWPHSSWNAYILDKVTKIKKEEVLKWFGEFENFLSIHRNFISHNSAFIKDDI